MRQVLPSGPKRDERTELSPFQTGVEFVKRHPAISGFIAGTFAPGIGNLGGAIAGWAARKFWGPFKVMHVEAHATHNERMANKFTELGNDRKAEEHNKAAEGYRKKLATM